ncbi:heavy metal translocating P-type ATPase [Agrococcus carbonis]|uniref:hypothetical protein n=2 Tax=Agrococcus TaxID=46352 RepID=UPI00155F7C7B
MSQPVHELVVAHTRRHERRWTAMIGDGINVTPALAEATVGIATGATGSVAAIESAHVAFTGRDQRLIPAAIRHARHGRLIRAANIVLALLIAVIHFPRALSRVLGFGGVVLVQEVAEAIVILNGVLAARRPAILSASVTPAVRTLASA